jgi:hypothetical protein
VEYDSSISDKKSLFKSKMVCIVTEWNFVVISNNSDSYKTFAK